METIHTDMLVIGGGLAGLRAGLAARKRGQQVIILSLLIIRISLHVPIPILRLHQLG